MIVKSRLTGQLRRPQSAAQRKALAHRDWLRRQQRRAPIIIPVGSAPVNTQQSSFQPQPPKQGEEVEANEGGWVSSTPITYEYQWQLNGVDIIGATAKSLLILVGMVGGALRCVVKAINSIGFTLSITASVTVVAI